MLRLALAGCLALAPLTVAAQDRPQAILVLDASGSMWGQIDGTAKITIAQEVVADLLATLPEDQDLGLAAYGHRERGNCADIETLVAPGSGTRGAIAEAVRAISPKGKTPMTDAVVAAAQAMRYTEEKATVILVSDGIETCNPDPCAAARLLEEAGVDFTAHVVGFDVENDPEALRQMQCLAGETGGQFLTAGNASELADALVTVAAAPEPEPDPVTISFRATLLKEGPEINEGLVWFVDGPSGPVAEGLAEPMPRLELMPGDYTVAVTRTEDEATVEGTFFVERLDKRVTLILPEIQHTAVLEGPAEAPVGDTIEVYWEVAESHRTDLITIARTDQKPGEYAYSATAQGESPTEIRMPMEPGDYELRFTRRDGGTKVLAARPITATPVEAVLEAPPEAAQASEIEVAWQGPGYNNDFITVSRTDQKAGDYITYVYTNTGNPAPLTLPSETGEYELRYVMQGRPDVIIATRPIAVVDESVTMEAPSEAVAGSAVEVPWQGPGNDRDLLVVATADQKAGEYITYAYTDWGNPAAVTMPLEPGEYELRYVAQGRPSDIILAAQPITVVPAEVSFDALAEVVAGSAPEIPWIGPDNKNDLLTVAEIGQKPKEYVTYAYTGWGNPLALTMPLEPGEYEIRYVGQGSQTGEILAAQPVTVIEAQVSFEIPAEIVAGSSPEIAWSGPDNKNDMMTVARPDQKPGEYITYAYATWGNPLPLAMPTEPGTYEVRYVGQGKPKTKTLTTRTVTVIAAEAAVEANAEAEAGMKIEVTWDGPANKNDLIVIARADHRAGEYETYTPANRGSPLEVRVPEAPGTYELRYIGVGKPEDKVLATRTLTVR